jgi:hypothetical protein
MDFVRNLKIKTLFESFGPKWCFVKSIPGRRRRPVLWKLSWSQRSCDPRIRWTCSLVRVLKNEDFNIFGRNICAIIERGGVKLYVLLYYIRHFIYSLYRIIILKIHYNYSVAAIFLFQELLLEVLTCFDDQRSHGEIFSRSGFHVGLVGQPNGITGASEQRFWMSSTLCPVSNAWNLSPVNKFPSNAHITKELWRSAVPINGTPYVCIAFLFLRRYLRFFLKGC